MHLKRSYFLFLVCLTATAGCASPPGVTASEPTVASMLDAKMPELNGPETNSFAAVVEVLTAAERRRCHQHIDEVEQFVCAHLREGSVGAAWIAGYFRVESSLPLLRHEFLTDRYFYGWEGPDPNQESSWLLDEQYTHHIAYMAAIEAISCRPLPEAVALTPKEIADLRAEAKVDFAKREEEPERVARGLCARWILIKLLPNNSGASTRS